MFYIYLRNRLIRMEHRIMSALDDLKSAIDGLKTQLETNNAEIDTLLTKITSSSSTDSEVSAAATRIRELTAANKAEVDKAASAAP